MKAKAEWRIMGVVNTTPDSFSDGGRYLDPATAVAHGLKLAEDGAAILDIGGESTRPGAEDVPLEMELARTLPVIEGIRQKGCKAAISIDTRKPDVARAAVAASGLSLSAVSSVIALMTALLPVAMAAARNAPHFCWSLSEVSLASVPRLRRISFA